jgi:hypothetical protein
LIILAVGAFVVLGVLLILLPVLLQGFQPRSIKGEFANRDLEAELYAEDVENRYPLPAKPPPPRLAPRSIPISEDFVPRTLSEKQWATAMEKLERVERRQKADQARFDTWKTFMETPQGGSVQSAFELLRRGKAEDGARLLEGVLPDLLEEDYTVQQPVLKAAIRLFKEAGRPDLLAQSLFTYLENLQERLTAGGLEGREKRAQSELLTEVQRLLADPRVRARGRL